MSLFWDMQISPELITSWGSDTPSYIAMDVARHIPIKKIACTSKEEYMLSE